MKKKPASQKIVKQSERHNALNHPDDPTSTIPVWKPSLLPPTTPHEPKEEDLLENLKKESGVMRGSKVPDPSGPEDAASNPFNTFVRTVYFLALNYNEALNAWRTAGKDEKAQALERYGRQVECFNNFIQNTELVQTSKESGFFLDATTVGGYVTDIRIMAHPKVGTTAGIRNYHSSSKTRIIPST